MTHPQGWGGRTGLRGEAAPEDISEESEDALEQQLCEGPSVPALKA